MKLLIINTIFPPQLQPYYSQLEYSERGFSIWTKVPWKRAPRVYQLQDVWGHDPGADQTAGGACCPETQRCVRHVFYDTAIIESDHRTCYFAGILSFSNFLYNFLFLELVKKELFELTQSSLVGFPNLIRTAMVTSPLLLVVYLLINTDKYVLTSSVWFSWRLKTSELNGKLKQRPYWGCSFRWSWSFTLRTQHTARC